MTSLLEEIKSQALLYGDENSQLFKSICWDDFVVDGEPLGQIASIPQSVDWDLYSPHNLPATFSDVLARSNVARYCTDPSQRTYWQGLILGLYGSGIEVDWDHDFPKGPILDLLYPYYLEHVLHALRTISPANFVSVLNYLWGLWVGATVMSGGNPLPDRALSWYNALSRMLVAKEGAF